MRRLLWITRSLVISEESAKLLFNNENAIGKVVTLNHTGVVPDGSQTNSKASTYG